MKEYRGKVTQLWTWVVYTALFVAAAVGNVVVAHWNVDGSFQQPVAAAIVGGVFWGAFALLSAWISLDFARGRLVVSQEGVVQVGVIRAREIALDEVREAKCGKRSGGKSQLAAV